MFFAISAVIAGIFLLVAAFRSSRVKQAPSPGLARSVLAVAGLASLLIGAFWVAGDSELQSNALTRAGYLLGGSVTAFFLFLVGLLCLGVAGTERSLPPGDALSLPQPVVRAMAYTFLVMSIGTFILAFAFAVVPP